MPEKKTTQRARRDRREGKTPSTQAGNYVAEEMRHKKSGKHPVKNRKQAIAIGLSKARKALVKVSKKPTAKKPTAKRTGTKAAAKTAKRAGTSGHSKRTSPRKTKKSGPASKSRSSRSQFKKS